MLNIFKSPAPLISKDRIAESLPSTQNSERTGKCTGSIRALKKGFGFIAGDDGVDYFFHWSSMSPLTTNFRDLTVQERVSFEWVLGERGRRAVSISVI